MLENNRVKTRISRETVEEIARALARMAEGENKPVPLPPERELAKIFKVGRRAVRLAIDQLVKRNMVVCKQGSGNTLLPSGLSVSSVFLLIPAEIKPDDPIYSALISQFTLYAREHQIQLQPIRMDRSVVLNNEYPAILLGKLPVEELVELTRRLKTIVSLADVGSEKCCQIYYDDYAIGKQAGVELLQRGHRRVLVLAGPQEYASARDRLAGIRGTAEMVGLELTVLEGKMNWRGGYELMNRYLSECAVEKRATAVFASNDWMAAGALQAMVKAGLRVPEDMSLLGCDDVSLAKELEPALATFRLDIGRWVEQVFVALEQVWRLKLPEKILLPAEFVERKSLKTGA
jgi:DNA-binding LacI/PurR family transcriptional regulator